jgi:hypothetical protein
MISCEQAQACVSVMTPMDCLNFTQPFGRLQWSVPAWFRWMGTLALGGTLQRRYARFAFPKWQVPVFALFRDTRTACLRLEVCPHLFLHGVMRDKQRCLFPLVVFEANHVAGYR